MAAPTTVTFTTDLGSFNVSLFVDSAPQSAANFISYATNLTTGYNAATSFFHRLVYNFVLQGGGYAVQNGEIVGLPSQAPVPSEISASRPNVAGTIAFATVANDPNSGTNQFFFNLKDNSSDLNAGFSVFGQITSGQDVLQTLGALPKAAGTGPFTDLPIERQVATATLDDVVNFRVTVTQQVADNAVINPFATATLTDPVTAETLTLSYAAARGSLSGGGFTGAQGSLSFTGTPAQAQAALRALVFTPAANSVAPGQSVDTGFTLTIAPAGFAARTDTTFAISALSVNDAPVIGGVLTGTTVQAGNGLRPFAALTLSDPDVGQTHTVTVVPGGASGAFTAAGFAASGSSYVFTGSLAAAQAALRAGVFTPTAGVTGTTAFGLIVSDGTATTSDSATKVSVVAAAAAGAASVTSGFSAREAPNVIRALPNGAGAQDPTGPIYAQFQAQRAIAADLDAGRLTQAQAETALAHLVDGTTSVAVAAYGFFTGRTPSLAGLNFLVNSTTNPTDLNDPYYRQFTTENRYINFAANLGVFGAGQAKFTADYGGLDLRAATAKAYQVVFGTAADAAKVSALLDTAVPNGLGGSFTRADYFAQYGGDGINGQGTKAAMIGFLLSNAVATGGGTYGAATLNYVMALEHGAVPSNDVPLVPDFTSTVSLVGQQPTLDPTVSG